MSKRRKHEPDEGHPEESDRMEVPIETPEAEALDTPPVEDALALSTRRIEELQERLKRVQAEFLNETRRIQRQADEGRKYAIERVVQDLLPVFDALHSARQGLAPAGNEGEGAAAGGRDAVREGLDLVEKELLNALARHGVERIEAHGNAFDPTVHQALFVVEDPKLAPGTVAHVLRPGFSLHGRVVRAAHVAVTKANENDDEAAPDPGDGTMDETAEQERS